MNWNNPSKDKPGSQHCVVTLISVHGKKQGSVPERVTYAHANSYLEMKRPFPRVSHSVQLSKSVPECLIVSQSVPKCPRAPHSVQEMVTYAHANSYLEMWRPFPIWQGKQARMAMSSWLQASLTPIDLNHPILTTFCHQAANILDTQIKMFRQVTVLQQNVFFK